MTQKNLNYYGISLSLMTEKNKMRTKEMPKLDVTPYVGTKATIVKAEVIKTKFGIAIKIETNPISLNEGDSLPEGVLLRASVLLGISQDQNGLFIGKDSKVEKWLKNHKIDIAKIPDNLKVGDLVKVFEGINVVCQKNPDSMFLSIV